MNRRSAPPLPVVFAVVAAALALKVVLLAGVTAKRPQAFTYIDTGTYLRPALALLRHGSFSPGEEAIPEPEINRTPGYPLLVVAAWRLLGERPWVPSLLGALLSAGTALVTARLATRLFGWRAGVAAAVLMSCEPGTFLRSLDILSDTPFTLALTLFVAAFAGYAGDEGTSPIRAGFWLALATLVRPLSYYLLPLGALFVLVVAHGRGRSPRQVWGAAAAFLLPALFLVGGWETRNLVRANAFTLSPIASSELLFYRAAPVLARAEGVPVPEMQEKLGNRERWYRSGGGTEHEIFGEARYRDLFPATNRLSLVELNARWRWQAIVIFAAHPVLTAEMAVRGAAVLLLTPSSLILSVQYGLFAPDATLVALYEDQRVGPFALRLAQASPRLFAVSVGLVALLAALWGAASKGLWLARREVPALVHVALLGTFFYVVVVSAGFEASDDRYRLPLVPIACVYAARTVAGAAGREAFPSAAALPGVLSPGGLAIHEIDLKHHGASAGTTGSPASRARVSPSRGPSPSSSWRRRESSRIASRSRSAPASRGAARPRAVHRRPASLSAHNRNPVKLLRTLAANVLIPLALAAGLFLVLEGGCRAALRLKTGEWPETQVTAYTRFVEKIGKAYRPHPLLIVAGRPDAVLEAAGHVVHFNARGQRVTNVRDVPIPKPAGTYRVLCEGGSTTFDLLAPDDAGTWPARLGSFLRPKADVVNGGFPGWTSLESLVSLETRDLDLSPDLVVVFSGVNDLQPAGHVPFASDYSEGHAEILPRVTGVAPVPMRFVSRLVFVEWLGGRLKPRAESVHAEGYAPSYEWRGGPKRDDIPPEAVAVYERNLRSTIAVAASAGARTLLVAQAGRVRVGREGSDRGWLEGWTPGLTPKGYLAGLARYNAVARKLGDEGIALYLDPFADGAFSDADFEDPVHFSPAGSERFAKALAEYLDAPDGPRSRGGPFPAPQRNPTSR